MTGAYSGPPLPRQARKVVAGGLEHHVLEWLPSAHGSDGAHEPLATALLLHGFMDAAASWEGIAPALVARGMRVLAPDLRGFGDAPRAPAGSSYYFPDYIADVDALLHELVPTGPLVLAGHSMGGVVATLYAGTFPERPAKVAVLEGLGPPDSGFDAAPERMREFVESTKRHRRSESDARGMADLDEVTRRLAMNHPGVDSRILRERAPDLVRQRDDGRFVWRFDSLHRARSPIPFYAPAFRAFASAITCPVLFVSGGPSGYHPADEAERLAAYRNLVRVEIEGAGHMMHWTRPARVAELLAEFFAR